MPAITDENSRFLYRSGGERSSQVQAATPHTGAPGKLKSHGTGAIGKPSGYKNGTIEIHPKVYLVLWGSQWNTKAGDPYDEATYVAKFLEGLYGPKDTWSTVLTQYCEGVPKGSTACGAGSTKVVHPTVSPLVDAFVDTSTKAPTHPTPDQYANEIRRAAAHFKNKTQASNNNVQYWILTASQNSPAGFGSLFCAAHGAANSAFGGYLAFVALPYIPDAGKHCDAGIVNPGNKMDGVSELAAHEYAEAVINPFPDDGWLDSKNLEIADKCEDVKPGSPGGPRNITLSTGKFVVPGLWSNNKGSTGGCVTYYKSATNQH